MPTLSGVSLRSVNGRCLIVMVGVNTELGFVLCQAIVEAIKRELPIWKQQFEADGRAVWSGLGL